MRNLLHHIISFFKKLIVITSTSILSYLVFDFIFENLHWLSIPLTVYTTYCIHFTVKYHTSFYDIPYDHESAYYKALALYNSMNLELVKGELITDPIEVKSDKKDFEVFFDWDALRNILSHPCNNKSFQKIQAA